MKTLLALLALLAIPSFTLAQSADTQSDSYVCYHGAANDPHTDEACARIQAAAAPRVTPTKAAPDKTAAASHSAAASPAAQNETVAAAPAAVAPTAAEPKSADRETTDVGETPLNAAQSAADETNTDQNATDNISIHSSWFAGLSAFVIILIIIAGFGGLAVYFIPTVIALARHKRSALAIFAVNLFFGWSFIGWVAALVWSLTPER